MRLDYLVEPASYDQLFNRPGTVSVRLSPRLHEIVAEAVRVENANWEERMEAHEGLRCARALRESLKPAKTIVRVGKAAEVAAACHKIRPDVVGDAGTAELTKEDRATIQDLIELLERQGALRGVMVRQVYPLP